MQIGLKMTTAGLFALVCAGLSGCSGGPSNKVIEEALVGTRPTLSGEEVETVSVVERGAEGKTASGASFYPVRVKLTTGANMMRQLKEAGVSTEGMKVKSVTLDYVFYQDEFDDWKVMRK